MSEQKCTRARALRAAALGGASLAGASLVSAWARPERSAARPSRAQDVRILKFLLVLEDAQAAFYAAALRGGALRGELLELARTVAPQEREHAELLRRRLGSDAPPRPKLDFTEATSRPVTFQRTAIDLEEATAAAYIGQGASLTPGAVIDAARIVAVEARHAAWLRDVAGLDPAPRAADLGRSADEVVSDLRRKGLLR